MDDAHTHVNQPATRWPVSTYTIAIPHMTVQEAPAEVKAAGYEGIEWRVEPPYVDVSRQPVRVHRNDKCLVEPTPEAMTAARHECERVGLRISGLGLPQEFNIPDAAKSAFELAEVAGVQRIRIQCGSIQGGQSAAAAYESAVRLCDAYVKEAAHHEGIKVVVHQHYGTIIASAGQVYRVLSQFDPRLIGCIYDPGNMYIEGYEDYRLGLSILGDYVAHVHLKNVRFARAVNARTWHKEWAPLDDGVVDFRYLFQVLEEFGYDGWIVMSDVGETRDERDMLPYNRGLLTQMISDGVARVERTKPVVGGGVR
jgi:sugar phosphate isomerase/epimerase